MKKHLLLPLLLIIIVTTESVFPQTPNSSDSVKSAYSPQRVKLLETTGGLLYAGSMTGLYALWYKDYPQSSFHLFNDNKEWLQMDKVGHSVTSYSISQVSYNACRWAGISTRKSAWWGGATGLGYLTVIEILDGFSSKWGFSMGDMAANTAGAFLFTGQQLLWGEQRITMKYSWHNTIEADYRPDLLGKDNSERWLKNYNGSTFWLSANIASFLPLETKFPRWLNLSVGYGAQGMLGGYQNPIEYKYQPLPNLQRQRQYYLSFDIDLRKINTKYKALNTVIHTFNILKIPMPTIEFNQGGKVKGYWLYF